MNAGHIKLSDDGQKESDMATSQHPAGDGAALARWAAGEARRLVDFARGSRHTDGFGWLDAQGNLDANRPVQTYITARMTYVFCLAHLEGQDQVAELIDHGLASLSTVLHDEEFGGWFHSTRREDRKEAYDHAFVVLAAATAVTAGRPGARALLDEALECVQRRFWDEQSGRSLDVWDRRWQTLEAYRGANANMHMLEAFLAASDATGDPLWRQRGLRIAEALIHGAARANQWRLPEHYDPDWQVLLEYNADTPDHPFRPYGATVGHWLEWARLLVHLHVGLTDPPGWLLDDARALFATAVSQGWAVDGAPGLVYTVDWQGRPVVRQRMHWVLAEGLAAAAVLARCTGEPGYRDWEQRWWAYADLFLVDRQGGSWHHELDERNRPAATVWPGKPDVYHAYQPTILTRAPLASSVGAAALALRGGSSGGQSFG